MEPKFTKVEVAGKMYYAITTSFNADSVNLNNFILKHTKPGVKSELKIEVDFENDHEAKRKEKITHFYSPKNMF
jgi:hypothetical protein